MSADTSEASSRRRLVLFDHDGVLADSFAVFSQAFLAACREEGLAAVATPDDLRALFDDNVYASLRDLGVEESVVRAVLARTSAVNVREAAAIPPFAGVREALARIAESHHVVIVTSNSEEVVGTWLLAHGARGVSEIAGAETGLGKAGKIAALRERFAGRDRVWFVGDTAGDMREALSAGARPLGVAWGWHAPERLRAAGAERIAAAPANLPGIVLE